MTHTTEDVGPVPRWRTLQGFISSTPLQTEPSGQELQRQNLEPGAPPVEDGLTVLFLLFLLIKGVRRDKEALLWFWCLSVCLQQLLRSLWYDSWTFSRNQQSPWFVVWEQSANYQLLTWDGLKKSKLKIQRKVDASIIHGRTESWWRGSSVSLKDWRILQLKTFR